jgi:hypothetical protein
MRARFDVGSSLFKLTIAAWTALSRGPPLLAGAPCFLFAALDAATGKVIGRCYPRHRGREFLSFRREISKRALGLDLLLV